MTDGIDLAGIGLAGIAAIGAIDTMIDFPHADEGHVRLHHRSDA